MPVPFSGCWLWLRSVGSHGYGNAYVSGIGNTTAQRASYTAFKGEIPNGMLVQHSCDERLCVNPDHLSLGTDKTNSDDKFRKGRANLEGRVFPPHPFRKLTDAQILTVRAIQEKQKTTARRLGVTQRVIWAIKNGRHYRDIAPGVRPALLPLLSEEFEMLNRLLRSA